MIPEVEGARTEHAGQRHPGVLRTKASPHAPVLYSVYRGH